MDNHMHLLSQDGSSNKNPSDRCPCPLDSQDSTQEEIEVAQDDQDENGNKVEVIEAMLMCDDPNVKDKTTPEISPDAGNVPITQIEVKEEEEEILMIKEEHFLSDINIDGSSNRNTPEGFPRPLYYWGSTQEDQDGNLLSIKDEAMEDIEPYMKEKITPEISTASVYKVKEEEEEILMIREGHFLPDINIDGSYNRNTPEGFPRPLYYWGSTQEDQEIPQDDQEENIFSIKDEAMENMELYVKDETPLEISTDPGNASKTLRNVRTEEKKKRDVKIKEEEICLEISTVKTEQNDGHMNIKEEEVFPEISTDICNSGGKAFSCSECSQCFTDRAKLISHKRSHKEENKCTCPVCGKLFNERAKMMVHKMSHKPGKPFYCLECGLSFSDQCYLLSHQKVHTGEAYSCSECGDLFTDESYLLQHQRGHARKKKKVSSNLKCKRTVSKKSGLKEHKVVNSRSYRGKQSFICTECGKHFASTSWLRLHWRTHPKMEMYENSTDPENTIETLRDVKTEEMKEGHMNIKEEEICPEISTEICNSEDKAFSCSECSQCFTDRAKLISHQRSHKEENKYTCPVCGKIFNERARMMVHQMSHKPGIPFSCLECGLTFSEQSYLLSHQKIHTGDTYSCAECGDIFTDEYYLFKHQRGHTRKVFSCSECNRSFSKESGLKKHKLIHTKSYREKQSYICTECGKRFRNNSHLKWHWRTHPEIEMYENSTDPGDKRKLNDI